MIGTDPSPSAIITPIVPQGSSQGDRQRGDIAVHDVDQTTEQMVRSVLAYAENRLRMNPVPFDKGMLPADSCTNTSTG